MSHVLIVGSSSTIATALAQKLSDRDRVFGLTRTPKSSAGGWENIATDYSESSLEQIADRLQTDCGSLDLVISCVGVLHDAIVSPEKRLSHICAAGLQHYFYVNTIIPALLIKYFSPLLPRDRPSQFAILSAKVGSIGDNFLGGWYGYRSSKAALNMTVKTAAIELARTHKQTCIVAIHPGTTESPLSAPFTQRLSADRLYSPHVTAQRILEVISGLDASESGNFFNWNGDRLPW